MALAAMRRPGYREGSKRSLGAEVEVYSEDVDMAFLYSPDDIQRVHVPEVNQTAVVRLVGAR
jgi:hypothetical protein